MTVHPQAAQIALKMLPPTWSVGPVLMNQNCPEYLRTNESTWQSAVESLAGEFGRPGRHGRQASPDGRSRQRQVGHRGEMVVDARDRDELRLGDGRASHAAEKQKPPRAYALAALAVRTG